MRIMAAALALAMLGGGVAVAASDADADTQVAETTTDLASPKPHAPEALIAAIRTYRQALKQWRHCIIDVVTGDTAPDTCGPAPAAHDFGLGEEALLEFDLNERLARRVDRVLTRIEIKTACITEHAAEGRAAVFECVFAAVHEHLGDHVRPIAERKACHDPIDRTAITTAGPATGADDASCEDAATVRRQVTDHAKTDGEVIGVGDAPGS